MLLNPVGSFTVALRNLRKDYSSNVASFVEPVFVLSHASSDLQL